MTDLATSTGTEADGREWTVLEPFLLRTAGLPFEVAERMRTSDLARWAADVRAAERDLDERAERIVAVLERVIGEQAAGSTRSALVSLKRDVFNGRRPREATLADADGALDEQTRAEVRDWDAAREALGALRADGKEVLEREMASKRELVRELAASAALQDAILLQSPTLYADVQRYLRRGAKKPDKRSRRTERTLLTYIYRAACKTSPFSTLTAVSHGSVVDAPDDALFPSPEGFAQRSAVRLNVAVLGRLGQAILGNDAARGDLPVRLTSGWTADADRVRYLRRSSTIADDRGGSITIDPVHESVFYLPSGELLEDLLEFLPDGRTVRFAELVEHMAALDPDGRVVADVQRYLHHLVRLGLLLVPPLQIDIHSPDPLRRFREGLEAIDRDWADALAARLRRVEEQLAGYPAAGPSERHAALEACRAELTAAFEALDRADVGIPRTLAYEDTSLPSSTMRADRRRWEGDVLADLQDFARILSAFDINLARRLVTKGFFRARYGEGGVCEDVLQFTHEFQRDFFDPYTQRLMRRRAFVDGQYQPQENWFKLPEIEAVDRARVAVAEEIQRAYDALEPDAEELCLPREAVERIARMIPDTLGELSSWAVMAQVTDGGRDVVLNRVTGGLGMLFNRFAHCFDDDPPPSLADRMRRALAAACPPGAVFAELRGFEASNLNLHPRVTDYELVCPGEVSNRPASEQIHLDDLEIRDDVERDRLLLWSNRLGCEVVPCYLGLLVPLTLPEVQQVLLNFSFMATAQIDLWMGTEVPLPDRTIAGYPRLRYGNVVFHRRMWKLHPDYFPARGPEQSDHEYFLEVARWREDNGLPERVFVTPDATAPSVEGVEPEVDDGEELDEAAAEDAHEPEADGGGVGYKPLYVDFDSVLSVGLLERYAQAAGSRLVMTEMLPGPDDLWLRDGNDRYVAELVFELGGARR